MSKGMRGHAGGRMNVEIEGLAELEAKLKAIGSNGKQILNKALYKGAGICRDDAARRASRIGSGGSSRRDRKFRGKILSETKNAMRLEDSITRRRDKKSNPYEETIYVQTKTFYAHMIEFGHSWVVPDRAGKLHLLKKKYAPHPFMMPAYESNRAAIREAIEKEAARLLRKHAKGTL
jgi:HK97 gp10 family phage protein